MKNTVFFQTALRVLSVLSAFFLAFALSACDPASDAAKNLPSANELMQRAGVPEKQSLGSKREDVLARVGAPTARHALAEGERLQYSQQPSGFAVYNLDFDEQGVLVRIDQPLVRSRFERDISVNQAHKDRLMLLYGKAAISQVARFKGDVWSYQFLDSNDPWKVHFHVSPDGIVRQISFSDERSARGY